MGLRKISYAELKSKMCAQNKEEGGKTERIYGTIVFREDNWPGKHYTLEQRSYIIDSDAKAFKHWMGGYSIFSHDIANTDPCLKLTEYMYDERGGDNGWKIDYCYLSDSQGKPLEE